MKSHSRTYHQDLKQVRAVLDIKESAFIDQAKLSQEITQNCEEMEQDIENDLTK